MIIHVNPFFDLFTRIVFTSMEEASVGETTVERKQIITQVRQKS